MANYSCEACSDLRNDAPNVVVNGITDTECASLGNNTGLNPASGNNDCTDLNNLNDCLVGNMEAEIEAYDVCEWKPFMQRLIPNLWTVLKGIICAICGLWTNVTNLLSRVAKTECFVSNVGKVQNFAIDEDRIKWFNGVTKNPDSSTDPDFALPRITGTAYAGYLTGSIVIPSDFETRFPSASITTHGILLYEYRVKLSDYKLRRFWPAQLQECANGSGIHAHVFRFVHGGNAPYGPNDTGDASYSVPEGWEYLQVRMSSYDNIPSSGKVTLAGVIPVLMNPNEFDC